MAWKIAVLFRKYGHLCTGLEAQIRFMPRNTAVFFTTQCTTREDVIITWWHDGDFETTGRCWVQNTWGGRMGERCIELSPDCLVLLLLRTGREVPVFCKTCYCCEKTLFEMFGSYGRQQWLPESNKLQLSQTMLARREYDRLLPFLSFQTWSIDVHFDPCVNSHPRTGNPGITDEY